MKEKTVLVVDDDEMNLQIAKMILERKLPCKVICVDNGLSAIEILKSRYVSLVLLDVLMPDFDGIETLQEIRNDKRTRNVPVMMLTASVDRENIQKAGMLGVKDYIRKPFLPADLVERVKKKLDEEKPSADILLIGDEKDKMEEMKKIIERNFNHDVSIAYTEADAEKALTEIDVSLILACADMKFVEGFKILSFLAEHRKFDEIPFAVTTSDKILEIVDNLKKPKIEEVPEVEEAPKVETKPELEEKPEVKEEPEVAKKPDKEPPKVEEKPAEETPAKEKVWKKPTHKIKEAAITPAEKKKLTKVVTNLIGYDLDLRI
ncbi:MAG: response regulator [Selenomonadaceae bacterium]|nr:response regulator [Selenomonadaceae bacterium]